MPILVFDHRRVAIDAGDAGDLQVRASAEEVELFELHADRVLAALAAERQARIQRPDIARRHRDIDAPVLEGDRLDRRIVEIAGGSQDARRLIDQALRVGIAALEQQLLTNHLRLRANVQLVREPVQPLVLFGVLQIEDVFVVDEYFADDGALAFELRCLRHGRRGFPGRDFRSSGHTRHRSGQQERDRRIPRMGLH